MGTFESYVVVFGYTYGMAHLKNISLRTFGKTKLAKSMDFMMLVNLSNEK